MSRFISVNPPKNLSKEDEHLFHPVLTFELETLTVKRLKHVFVTYSGLCVLKSGLVKESHHWYPDQYDGYLGEVSRCLKAAYEKPDNLVRVEDGRLYLLIHHLWSINYYHWICESIPRILMVKDELEDMVLLIPQFYKTLDFVRASLEPFKFKDVFVIPSKKGVYVESICLPQIKPIADGYDPEKLKEIRSFYLNYVIFKKKIALDLGERIYISRRKAARKKVDNETALEDVLIRFKFTIVCAEEFSFFEQVAIFSNARYLVSIHGSGLTNMLFMPENSYVLEFQKRKTNDHDRHSPVFWYLADCLGHSYYYQLCDPTDIHADYFNADFIVDKGRFEENLWRMLPNG